MLDLNLLDIKQGDALDCLRDIPTSSVDMIFTSPPYADRRKKHYNGVKAKDYIKWFLPIGYEIKRILKPTGSFLLNIQSHCEDRERLLYPMKLIIVLSEIVDFKYIDEYCWYKSASPGVCGSRLRPCWEPVYHLANDVPYINQEEIAVHSNSKFINQRGWASLSVTGNIGGYHDIAEQGEGLTQPDSMLYFPTSLLVKDGGYVHPAKFPYQLALFLVKAFCPPGGTVCDPFAGSGTTALASLIHGCKCHAIDLEQKYCDLIQRRIEEYNPPQELDFQTKLKWVDEIEPE